MTPTTQEKIKKLRAIGDNPRLALFQALQELEKKLAQIEQEAKDIAQKQAESVISEAMAQLRGELLSEAEKLVNGQILSKISTIEGKPGDVGYSPKKGKDYWTESEINEVIAKIQSQIKIPKKGIDYFDGITPKVGIDYPTTEQIRKIVKVIVSGIKIENGKTPIKGVDYFTKNEIDQIISQIKLNFPKIELKATEIRDKLQSLQGEARLDASAIKNLKKIMSGTGKPMLKGAGGPTLKWEVATRTAIRTFTMPTTPYSTDMVMFFLNGALQQKTENYTISGKTITTTRDTESDEVGFAFYREL